MTDETLVVVSIGLCLGMVFLATHLGFSSALGAFIMGSLIAEAPNAEHIEHLVSPIKDLFGAVFFVSVGMMVSPALLADYAIPVAVLVATTILGQLFFSTCGVLAAGQKLHTAVLCGFSLTQIGEFSFILATLGMNLGVTSDFLYPIIVAVSVITTFTTPFFINAAEPAYAKLVNILPQRFSSHALTLPGFRTTAIRIPNTNGRIPLFSTAYKFYHKMIKCHIGIIRHCEYDKSIHHYRL